MLNAHTFHSLTEGLISSIEGTGHDHPFIVPIPYIKRKRYRREHKKQKNTLKPIKVKRREGKRKEKKPTLTNSSEMCE